MIFLLRYWKPLTGLLIVGLALGGMYWWGYSTKAVACELAAQQAETARLNAVLAERERWQARAEETDKALAKALERPQAAPRIREVTRANPSGCNLPDPVAASLREQIAAANKAGAAR